MHESCILHGPVRQCFLPDTVKCAVIGLKTLTLFDNEANGMELTSD